MEVKINKEIRNFTEHIVFGLSLRQFLCTIFAMFISLVSYFIFKPILGLEITSWICVLFALPIILIGFMKYNGMPLEKFVMAYIKSELLTPKELKFKAINIYEYILNLNKEEINIGKKHNKEIIKN